MYFPHVLIKHPAKKKVKQQKESCFSTSKLKEPTQLGLLILNLGLREINFSACKHIARTNTHCQHVSIQARATTSSGLKCVLRMSRGRLGLLWLLGCKRCSLQVCFDPFDPSNSKLHPHNPIQAHHLNPRSLHVVNGVGGLHIQGDGLARKGLDLSRGLLRGSTSQITGELGNKILVQQTKVLGL